MRREDLKLRRDICIAVLGIDEKIYFGVDGEIVSEAFAGDGHAVEKLSDRISVYCHDKGFEEQIRKDLLTRVLDFSIKYAARQN
ncbi:hypothetical protein CMI45_00380 [Candidatus Pacearchaeota archaeon]|nr:hypothetical protein [Candidatus Pacearchaeota archaeon]|tara:strand:+ start:905 stop:1156 length:252 start_codon:yes stop_codon:yes gene_type:complete